MSKKITSKKDTSVKKKKRWSKSVSTPDGLHKQLEVEEIDNGYLITISKHGNVGDKWIDDSKKVFSETNPFEADEKSLEEKNIDAMRPFVSDSIFDNF